MNPSSDPPPRCVPEMAFPPYAFVPGRLPHPTHSPEGHSYGMESAEPDPPEEENWRGTPLYLYGIDLFNYGYYWEAHEAWEALWQACGRAGPEADFLKGLIKLAAAGVKVREGQLSGVQIHALGALDLFDRLSRQGTNDSFMGLSLSELKSFARRLADRPFTEDEPAEDLRVVFSFFLRPQN